ncbi:Flagellar basal-body rod protein FlgC (plasmid) [Rhodovastum atsumiense]|uniref:flagellar basal body rod protein FlgC n=1 Tax=Rhodovastum atsumiense TaxID=504468 RepID=UPI0020242F10|nr:flagellar basal body rod protein FlgC [Rhodovastum atsumiense]CAH2605429.1 Flagellar basal-body rod protein FlgC [Rhodovastum atsumiense]
MYEASPITGRGPLNQAMATSASGMRVQATRLRVVAENLANVTSTAATPGGDPFRRKVMSFDQRVDRQSGAALVGIGRITTDEAPFRTVYEPSHPAANAQGYVKMPNVSALVEVADMREAQRTYEANLTALTQARAMLTKTIDILKA